jgi:hypothetical protein
VDTEGGDQFTGERRAGEGLMAWWVDGLHREKNEREKVRRGDGRTLFNGRKMGFCWSFSGREDKSSTGGKFKEEHRLCLSVAEACLQQSLLVMGKKAMGKKAMGYQTRPKLIMIQYRKLRLQMNGVHGEPL